jgi:hypothetical protein
MIKAFAQFSIEKQTLVFEENRATFFGFAGLCFCVFYLFVVGFFVCVCFFWGFVVGFFLVLGCFLGFVWLLLWLLFFNIGCGVCSVLFVYLKLKKRY